MKSIEESVVYSMDGTNPKLFKYLPYILQDISELGASPDVILNLIKKHKRHYSDLKILDLGSGKGSVSIRAANELKCLCYGIDAIKEFVEESRIKSEENSVVDLCRFEVGDIRIKEFNEHKFDIIILGAIGPVFGDYFTTLSKLKNHLSVNGLIIIDDSYSDDSKKSNVISKSSIITQANKAGMKIIDEEIISKDKIEALNYIIFLKIKRRCEELIIKDSKNKYLFEDYIRNQAEENRVLENDVICSTMIFAHN